MGRTFNEGGFGDQSNYEGERLVYGAGYHFGVVGKEADDAGFSHLSGLHDSGFASVELAVRLGDLTELRVSGPGIEKAHLDAVGHQFGP